ncbi:hypothetical protein SAMN05661093_10547 [Kibdelosporangium aridum]|uniref:Uncharacterized protein n=1 Tax=Kibdelosporangium aridum TaxID=2030 RepID=A0A1Y5YAS1_KIBAR|nr:hypothetical protein SAMN05661093_10547 [Kibdelosporangium aridum]
MAQLNWGSGSAISCGQENLAGVGAAAGSVVVVIMAANATRLLVEGSSWTHFLVYQGSW